MDEEEFDWAEDQRRRRRSSYRSRSRQKTPQQKQKSSLKMPHIVLETKKMIIPEKKKRIRLETEERRKAPMFFNGESKATLIQSESEDIIRKRSR